jgi:hypothetical protein
MPDPLEFVPYHNSRVVCAPGFYPLSTATSCPWCTRFVTGFKHEEKKNTKTSKIKPLTCHIMSLM